MRILDRYLLRLFTRSFLMALGSFILIFVVMDFFEKVGGFIDRGTPWGVILRLYLFQIPYFMTVVMPIAMLLASLFTLGRISRDNELTAILSSGRSLLRTAVPLLLMGVLISVAAYFFNDQVVTRSKLALEPLQAAQEEAGRRNPVDRGDVLRQITRRGPGDTFYWGDVYSIQGQSFENLAVMRYEDSHLAEYMLSEQGMWSPADKLWILRDGRRRQFDSAGDSLPFRVRTRDFAVFRDRGPGLLPEDFTRDEKDPEAMEFTELREHIRRSSQAGEDAERLLVDLYVKTSYPTANFIIVLLGIALSATRRRISLAEGFGWTMGLGLVYILLLRMGLSFGHSEILPAGLAAWVGNIIFFLLGSALLLRANR